MTVYSVGVEEYKQGVEASVEWPLQHQAPSEHFLNSLQNPVYIPDDSGVNHAVYLLNDEYKDIEPPLVFNLPFEIPIVSRQGALIVNALATQLQRPIITIDRSGTGGSENIPFLKYPGVSIESVAESKCQILGKLETTEADIAGICLGGTVAVGMSKILGPQVRSLHTFSAVGFEDDIIRRYARRAEAINSMGTAMFVACTAVRKIMEESNMHSSDVLELILGGMSTPVAHKIFRKRGNDARLSAEYMREAQVIDNEAAGTLQKMNAAALSTRGVLSLGILCCKLRHLNLIEGSSSLDPHTVWYDFVGTEDQLTDYQSHAQAVDTRTTRYPDTSYLTIIEGAGHNFFGFRVLHTARAIDRNLALLAQT